MLSAVCEAVGRGLSDGGASNVRVTQIKLRCEPDGGLYVMARAEWDDVEPHILSLQFPPDVVGCDMVAVIVQRRVAQTMRETLHQMRVY